MYKYFLMIQYFCVTATLTTKLEGKITGFWGKILVWDKSIRLSMLTDVVFQKCCEDCPIARIMLTLLTFAWRIYCSLKCGKCLLFIGQLYLHLKTLSFIELGIFSIWDNKMEGLCFLMVNRFCKLICLINWSCITGWRSLMESMNKVPN